MEDRVIQIGVLMGNIFTKHPMEVLRGLSLGAAEHNVNLTILPGAQGDIYNYWEQEEEDDNIRFSAYNYQYNSLYDYTQVLGLDAVILTYGTLMMFLDKSEKSTFFDKFKGIPLVILQEYNENEPYCYLIADNYRGMYDIVTHLIEVHDRKKIVFLGGPKMNTDAAERLRGYYDAMRSHGYEVDSKMFVYGDYSQSVDYLVEQLLDDNPDADAIACANDEMSLCVYRVCRNRGIIIGKDISVTGFDDVEFASTLNPPLTTGRQDGFAMGRQALELAIQGMEKEDKTLHRLDIPLIIRGSCGCDYTDSVSSEGTLELIDGLHEHWEPSYIKQTAEAVAGDCMEYRFKPEVQTACAEFFEEVINIVSKIVDSDNLDAEIDEIKRNYKDLLRSKLDFATSDEIVWSDLSKYFHRIIHTLMGDNCDWERIRLLDYIRQRLHEHIEAMFVQTGLERRDRMEKSYWEAALVIQRLKERVRNDNAFLRTAMQQVISQGAKSAYLLINIKPIIHNKGDAFICPDAMRVVASSEGEEIKIYKKGNEELITKRAGFTRLYPNEKGHMYTTFLLFSENEQYGLLVAEITPEQLSGMHGVSMQLSNGLSIMSLTQKEDAAKSKLNKTLRELRERNKILDSVSSIDPMTGVHNRRGFMEKVLELNRINDGRQAHLFFCDLDHLKQINDEFGHNDGDYAIKTIANVLHEILGEKGCLGRIGGDEFIAMVPCRENEAAKLVSSVKTALNRINKTSGKPYYVECSMGYKVFTCNEDVDIDEVIKQADEVMYKDKAKRRATIKKEEGADV